MRNYCLISLFVTFLYATAYGQKTNTKENPFQMVDVPDSIYTYLEKEYKEITGFDSTNAGRNVFNLSKPKDYIFKNGLYSFQGQGPHFPRLIFIYYNGLLYTFKNRNITDVLEEYLQCIKLLKLPEADSIRYLKFISEYLKNELGRTYGAVIKERE